MKFQIERAALLACLAHIQSVVERRNTIPILSNVRIEAARAALALQATDMDMEIAERTVAAVATPGATTVNAHVLYDIVRKLPEGSQVEIALKDSAVTVAAGRSRFSLPCLPVEDYPAFAGGEFSHTFEIGAAALRGLIDRARFAICNEETRYYLNGIYLHHSIGGALRAVATDGHRLAKIEAVCPKGAAGMPGIIIPRKAVGQIRKLIEEAEGDISVSLSDAKLKVAFGEVELTTKLIDGTFPDYERVIPQSNDKAIKVDRQALAGAVDRVSAIGTEKARAIKFEVDRGLITLAASSADAGSASEEVEADYAGASLEIGFNYKYLLEVLDQVEGDAAVIALSDAAAPAIITDPANASDLFVLMPMRV